jgi:hypothetical protein
LQTHDDQELVIDDEDLVLKVPRVTQAVTGVER